LTGEKYLKGLIGNTGGERKKSVILRVGDYKMSEVLTSEMNNHKDLDSNPKNNLEN
jgi:hypothetical protein